MTTKKKKNLPVNIHLKHVFPQRFLSSPGGGDTQWLLATAFGASMDGAGWLLWDTQQSLGMRPRRVKMHVGIFALNLWTPIKLLGRKENQGKLRSVPAFAFLHLPPQRRGDTLPHVLPGKEMAVKLLRSFAVPPFPLLAICKPHPCSPLRD